MHEFLSSEALFDTWSEMLKATLFEVEEPVFYYHGDFDNHEPFWMYFEAFKHFFETDIQPKIAKPEKEAFWYYVDESARPIKEGCQKLLKFRPEKKHDICFSFAEYEKTNKGLTPESLQMIKRDLNGIELDDSRNFDSVETIINNINTILESRMYVGTKCSWHRFAGFMDIPVLRVIQDYPIKSFR